jgi:hypothetical protein
MGRKESVVHLISHAGFVFVFVILCLVTSFPYLFYFLHHQRTEILVTPFTVPSTLLFGVKWTFSGPYLLKVNTVHNKLIWATSAITVSITVAEVVGMRGSTKVKSPIFSPENVISVTVKFTWMIHTTFAIIRLFFYKVFTIFNIILPPLSKILHTSVVKFPALTSEHIMKCIEKLK